MLNTFKCIYSRLILSGSDIFNNLPSIGEALRFLREKRNLYQYDIASRLSIAQKNVCVIEKREDLYISTLKKYVEALGGTLRVTVELTEPKESVDLSNSIKT